jgi:hypothetical protein
MEMIAMGAIGQSGEGPDEDNSERALPRKEGICLGLDFRNSSSSW